MINLNKLTNQTWLTASAEENWPVSNPQSISDFQSNLAWLMKYLKQSMRDIEYWDVYHFMGSVEDGDNFAQKYASLANNEALVINSAFDKFHVGDVVLKDYYGKQHIIPTRQNGVFKPVSYENSILTFEYATQVNEKESIKLTIPAETEISQQIYSKKEDVSESHEVIFSAIDGIIPVIKFYDNNNEEVYYNIQLTLTNEKYMVSNIPAIVSYVVVK